ASDLLHGSGWTFVREPSSDANLFEACEVGDVGRVRELLGADATLAKVKEVGHIMPLHGAAAQGHKEIVELLVQAGADVNAANQWGVTPIYFAAAWGHKEVAMFLIDRGADVHVKAHDGETPLQVAKRKGHEEVVQLLTRTERLRTSGENKHVAAYFLVMVAVFCLGLGLVCLTIPGGSEKLTEQQAYAIGWMMTAIGVVASLATTYLLITGARERGFFLTDRVLKKTRAAVGKHRREAEVKKTWPSVCADCGLPDPEGMYAQLPGGRRRCRKCLGILGP
ncbi:MAG: ankyrin repeat domain-containing protein, partial [Planctomycetota bacterium]